MRKWNSKKKNDKIKIISNNYYPMNTNTKPQLSLITQEHIDTIADYYPSIDINHISDLNEKNGMISFRYEERGYSCVIKRKKRDSIPTYPYDIIESQWDFIKSVFQILEMWHEHTKKVNYAMFEWVKNIITEYYSWMDVEKISEIHFSGWHILFRYYTGIYMCPVKHMYEFQDKQSLRDDVVKISDIIKEYYPNVFMNLIHDIIIEEGMIGFEYMSEKYFCPIKSPENLALDFEKAREKETEVFMIESIKKPFLKVVK